MDRALPTYLTSFLLRINGNTPPVPLVQQDAAFEDDHESSLRLPVVSAVKRGLRRLNGVFISARRSSGDGVRRRLEDPDIARRLDALDRELAESAANGGHFNEESLRKPLSSWEAIAAR